MPHNQSNIATLNTSNPATAGGPLIAAAVVVTLAVIEVEVVVVTPNVEASAPVGLPRCLLSGRYDISTYSKSWSACGGDGKTVAGQRQEASDLLNIMQLKARMYLVTASLFAASCQCPNST